MIGFRFALWYAERMFRQRVAAICAAIAVLAASEPVATWVLPAGQESLIAASLGGEPVVEGCSFEGAQIRSDRIVATYGCPGTDDFDVLLRHPSTAEGALRGGSVAVVPEEDTPAGFAEALAARLSEQDFSLEWKTTSTTGAPPAVDVEVRLHLLALLGAVVVVLALFRRWRKRHEQPDEAQPPSRPPALMVAYSSAGFFLLAVAVQQLLGWVIHQVAPGLQLDAACGGPAWAERAATDAQRIGTMLRGWSAIEIATAATLIFAAIRRHLSEGAAGWAGVSLVLIAAASPVILPGTPLPGQLVCLAVVLSAVIALVNGGAVVPALIGSAALGLAITPSNEAVLLAVSIGLAIAHSSPRPLLVGASAAALGAIGLLNRGVLFPQWELLRQDELVQFLALPSMGWLAGWILRGKRLPPIRAAIVLPLFTGLFDALILDGSTSAGWWVLPLLAPTAAAAGLTAFAVVHRIRRALPANAGGAPGLLARTALAWSAAAAVLVAFFATRDYIFDADSVRDLAVAVGIVDAGLIPRHGPMLHGPWLHHSTVYNWLLAGVVALWRDPFALVAAQVVSYTLAALLFFELVRDMFSQRVAAIATGLLLSSQLVLLAINHVSHAPYVLVLEVLAVHALWKLQTRGHPVWLVLAALWVSLAVQFHLTALAVAPLWVAVLLGSGRRFSTPWLLATWAAAMLPLEPWLYASRAWTVWTHYGFQTALAAELASHSLVLPSLVAVLLLGRPAWLAGRRWRQAALGAAGVASLLLLTRLVGAGKARFRLFSMAFPEGDPVGEDLSHLGDLWTIALRLFRTGTFFDIEGVWAQGAVLSVAFLGLLLLARESVGLRLGEKERTAAILVVRWAVLALPVVAFFSWRGDYARYRIHLIPAMCVAMAFAIEHALQNARAAAHRILAASAPEREPGEGVRLRLAGTTAIEVGRQLGLSGAVVAAAAVVLTLAGTHRELKPSRCDDCLDRPLVSRQVGRHLQQTLGLGADDAWRVHGSAGAHGFGEVTRTLWYIQRHLQPPPPASTTHEDHFVIRSIRRRDNTIACVGERIPGTGLQVLRRRPALASDVTWLRAGPDEEEVPLRLPYRAQTVQTSEWPRELQRTPLVTRLGETDSVAITPRGRLTLLRQPPQDRSLNGLELLIVGENAVLPDCSVVLSTGGVPLLPIEATHGELEKWRFRVPRHELPLMIHVSLDCRGSAIEFLDVYDVPLRKGPQRPVAGTERG